MTASVGGEVHRTVSTLARQRCGSSLPPLPKPDDAAREDVGGFIEPLGIAHQFGAQGVGASLGGVGIESVSHDGNAKQ